MYQLELVFRLLVRLQFMYFQYNVYLSIVVRTNIYKYIYIYIYIYIYTHVIQNNLRTPQLAGFARQLGCKKMRSQLDERSHASMTLMMQTCVHSSRHKTTEDIWCMRMQIQDNNHQRHYSLPHTSQYDYKASSETSTSTGNST